MSLDSNLSTDIPKRLTALKSNPKIMCRMIPSKFVISFDKFTAKKKKKIC